MDSLDSAIHEMAHKKLPALAKTMGINEQSLRNKVCPTNDLAKLSVQEWRSMMLITKDIESLRVFASDFDLKLVGNEVQTSTIFDALLSVNKELGDVSTSIQIALADNHLSERECATTRQEIEEARQALDVLEKSVQQQAGKRI